MQRKPEGKNWAGTEEEVPRGRHRIRASQGIA